MSQLSFTGKWKVNVAASEIPFPAPQSVVVTIVDDGTELSIIEDSTDAAGHDEHVELRARFDGELCPVTGSWMVDQFAVRRVDDRSLRTRGAKDGKEVFAATLELAADGDSFTEKIPETTLADGTRAPAMLVFERV